MAERTRTRERETESEPSDTRLYEPKVYEYVLDELDRAAHGQIVVKAKDRPWDMHRQSNSKHYLSVHEPELKATAVHQWEVFLQSFADRTSGIVLQHVNGDPNKPALLAFVEPNTSDALGIDRGCGFEQIEDAPE
jgi:hypothetical protein